MEQLMPERRSGRVDRRAHNGCPYLTDEDTRRISEQVAQLILQKVYMEVGKSTLRKLFWTCGAAILGVGYWLNSKGWL